MLVGHIVLTFGVKNIIIINPGLCYLGSQQPGQVDFRNHLAASVSFSLVTVLVILHQVPQFSSWTQTKNTLINRTVHTEYEYQWWRKYSDLFLEVQQIYTPAAPVSWSGVIIGALDLKLSGLLDVRSNDSADTKTHREISYLLWLEIRQGVNVCALCTVSAQRSGEGEGVGDVVGRNLLLDECHQRAVCYLATQQHTSINRPIAPSISWLIIHSLSKLSRFLSRPQSGCSPHVSLQEVIKNQNSNWDWGCTVLHSLFAKLSF